MKYSGKKGESGIAVLFILIGILLIAVLFSMLYIKYGHDLKNKAGILFERTKTEASSAIKILEIGASDGRIGYLTDFTEMIRILPGSAEVSLSSCSLLISSGARRAFLDFREGGTIVRGNDGYNTWTEEEYGSINNNTWIVMEEDLDDDSLDDYFLVNASHVWMNLSSWNNNITTIQLNSTNMTINITQGNQSLGNYAPIQEESITYGYLNISGVNENRSLIDLRTVFTIIPKEIYKGYFTVEYIARAGVPVENVIKDGDTVLIYFEGFKEFYPDEFISFNFICPNIVPIEKTVFTGNTIPKQKKVVLYPTI